MCTYATHIWSVWLRKYCPGPGAPSFLAAVVPAALGLIRRKRPNALLISQSSYTVVQIERVARVHRINHATQQLLLRERIKKKRRVIRRLTRTYRFDRLNELCSVCVCYTCCCCCHCGRNKLTTRSNQGAFMAANKSRTEHWRINYLSDIYVTGEFSRRAIRV